MSTVDSRMRGFEKKGCLKRGGKNSQCEKAVKESTFRGGGDCWCMKGWEKALVVCDLKYNLLFLCLQMISLHRNTLIYALWIVRWNKKKKICIDITNQNEVSDCLRIKTMLSKAFHPRCDWFNVSLIMTDGCCVCLLLFIYLLMSLTATTREAADKLHPSAWVFYFFLCGGSHPENPIRFLYQFTGGDLSPR